jgi:hypothetical protein
VPPCCFLCGSFLLLADACVWVDGSVSMSLGWWCARSLSLARALSESLVQVLKHVQVRTLRVWMGLRARSRCAGELYPEVATEHDT